MKRNYLFCLVAFTLVFQFFGCATHQEVDENGKYSSVHDGIFPGPDNAINSAIADRIRASADYTRAETKSILENESNLRNSENGTSTFKRSKYNILFINSSHHKILRVGLSVDSIDGAILKDVVKGDIGTEFCINDRKFVAYSYTLSGVLNSTLQYTIDREDFSVPYTDGKRYSAIINMTTKK